MLTTTEADISIGVTNMRRIVFIWLIAKALLATADCFALEVIAAGQSFAELMAVLVDLQTRLAVNQPGHRRGTGLTAHPEVIRRRRFGDQAQGSQLIKSGNIPVLTAL